MRHCLNNFSLSSIVWSKMVWSNVAWISLYTGFLLWSAYQPKDPMTWWMEVTPALMGACALVITWRRFHLTSLAYMLVLLHCIILMVGGHYTYAEVPVFDTLRDLVNGSRNQFDKLGHFAQGFVPALLAREILIRKNIIQGAGWRAFLIVCFCLAFSAFYELVEWWAALIIGGEADAFLGTQGYVWDTQSDMAMALFGAITALLLLGRVHDRQLQQIHPVHE